MFLGIIKQNLLRIYPKWSMLGGITHAGKEVILLTGFAHFREWNEKGSFQNFGGEYS
jgi:hypothetical protein